MLRWSTRHPIPLNLSNKDLKLQAHSVAIGSDVLILINKLDGYLKMAIFQTDTGKTIEFTDKSLINKNIRSMTHYDGHVYIWAYEKINRGRNFSNHILYDFDIKNLTSKEVMRLKLDYCRSETPIINGYMYVLENLTDKMHVINLETKEVNVITLNGNYYGDGSPRNLYAHKEKLYILYKNYLGCNVSVIEHDQVRMLVSGVYSEGRECLVDPSCDWMDGTMLCRFATHFMTLLTFDFEGLRWIKQEVESGFQCDYQILTSVKVNHTIYTITQKGEKLEIRALELKPSISTMCLFSIIDRVINGGSKEDVEKIRRHFQLRPRLDLMLEWRLAEKVEKDTREHFEELRRLWNPILPDVSNWWEMLTTLFCCG